MMTLVLSTFTDRFFPRYAPLDRGHRRIGRLMAHTIHPMIALGYNYPWRGTMWTLGDSGWPV